MNLNFQIEENGLAFVYCIGALKVLSANTDNSIGEILVQYGVLQVSFKLFQHYKYNTFIECSDEAVVTEELINQ